MSIKIDPRRDAAVMRLVRQGQNGEIIGRQFGLSRQRIKQIAKNHGVLSMRQPPKHSKICPQCGNPKKAENKTCSDCRHINSWTIKTCPGCGESRPIPRYELAVLKSLYCRACYFKTKWESHPCAWCGEPITRRRSAFRYGVVLHHNTNPRHCLSKWRVAQKRSFVLQEDDGKVEAPVVR